jgi:hypothetical protein
VLSKAPRARYRRRHGQQVKVYGVAQQRPLAGPVRVRGVTPNVHQRAGEKALIWGLAS